MSEIEFVGYESLASFDDSERFARLMDKRDPLAAQRGNFLIPKYHEEQAVYLAGHLLGLQPEKTREFIDQELSDWARLGSEANFHAKYPWFFYSERLANSTARLVGALPHEVAIMNSLTVNLHLMLTSFYRPDKRRYKILIEDRAFPSIKYAVDSHFQFHGLDPQAALIRVRPRADEFKITHDDILALINSEGERIALVLLGSCNYYTGQAFNIPVITEAAHKQGCLVGFDLAHGAGNLDLRLHDWDVDFAVWSGYRYLNAGPGAIGGCFVNDRYAMESDLPRFAGWWGHDRETRLHMEPVFQPITGAEGWQVSNPSVLQMACLAASMDIFDKVGMAAIRKKGDLLTGYLEFLAAANAKDALRLITPQNINERGSQLSFKVFGRPKDLVRKLKAAGVICELGEPDVLKVTPAPLYNSFYDVYKFAHTVAEIIGGRPHA